MIPRHPLSDPDMPLHEGVLWLEDKLLDVAADLSNLREDYGIGDEGPAPEKVMRRDLDPRPVRPHPSPWPGVTIGVP